MSRAATKKRENSSSRVASSQGLASFKEASSLLASASEGSGEPRKGRCSVWPEWNDAEINLEKWDSTKGSRDGKAGKSPSLPVFEDPEGKIELPGSLKVCSWIRPLDFIAPKPPVVVENESTFDITSANEHLLCSELIRRIISEIYIVWKVCSRDAKEGEWDSPEPRDHAWSPWEHIYSLCKASKGHMPLYNPYGKYVVRLFWMGCWRKITVDDLLPFDEENRLLLPASTVHFQLWPMLLAKGIIKLANTEVGPGQAREMEDFSIVHTLTGWLPEFIPLQTRYLSKLWEFLTESIPKFQHAEWPEEAPSLKEAAGRRSSTQSEHQSQSPTENRGSDALGAGTQAAVPQIVVCASYQPQYLLEKTSVLGQMADSSEKLRRCGLSQLHSHTVLVNRTRACPLITPPKPPPIPRWKLVRLRKQMMPTDEPKETPDLKPDRFIEISSPFLNRLTAVGNPEVRSCSSTLASFTEQEEQEDQDLPHVGVAGTSDTMEGTAGEVRSGEENVSSAEKPKWTKGMNPVEATLQETWLDLDDFVKCFQTLLVFHKPDTYANRYEKSSFKSTSSSKASSTSLSTASAQAMPVKPQATSLSADDKGILFLLVDSLLPSQILISFSLLAHWGGTPDERKYASCQPGLLLARPFSWKTVQFQLPVLNIQTTSTKAALLSLPPGRRVLRLTMQAPLAYHVALCSTAPFLCEDEDAVMAHLSKDSVRFREQAALVLGALSRVVSMFSNAHELPAAMMELGLACGPPLLQGGGCGEHAQVFSDAVFHMVTVALNRKLTTEEVFALQALLRDPSAGTGFLEHSASSGAEIPELWRSREATAKETAAASVLQAGWRGLHVREVIRASRPGMVENTGISKTLRDIWALVESDREKHAASLLRHIFSSNEKMAVLYPCYEDEPSRVLFTDYSVAVPEQPAHSWGLVFREVFFVHADVLLEPKVYTALAACVLHVIDNDSGKEVPRVFQEVEPHVYRPNQRGYTFVAEAQFGDTPPPAGRWRMRLIRSCDPPAQLSRDTPLCSFATKEFRDYYIPDERNIICRFSVKVTRDHVGTVQVQMTEPDIYVKLTVLDGEEEVASATGRAQAIVPTFRFSPNDPPKPPPGGQGSSVVNQSGGPLTATSRGLGEYVASSQLLTADNQLTQPMSHKYIIQAEVLHKSRSLYKNTEASQEKDRTTVIVEKQEDQVAAASMETASSEGQKASTPRSSRRTKEKEKSKTALKTGLRQGSQILDVSRPQWTLRFVSDQSEADSVQVSKDTERADEIKAMKKAWEAVDPGRSLKAQQVRLQFISKHLGQGHAGETVDEEAGAEAGTPDVLLSPSSTDVVQPCQTDPPQPAAHTPVAVTPFIGSDVLSDSWKPVVGEHRKPKAEHIQSFRLVRDIILEHRRQEKESRNALKRRQVEMYDELQILLNEQRLKTLKAREGYWSPRREVGLRQKEAELLAAQQAEPNKGPLSAQPLPKGTMRAKSANKKK
ncbi:androglobin isoform X2 [Brienomyrus brachyistius]|uniref:androglobin isoform X2 n=1 Tax=Brienomyrus brachyistius TaxID=42636 RepID=UPI0020B3FD98|nr:androglobin isoform X2 [Brienomyrus brachyistius]